MDRLRVLRVSLVTAASAALALGVVGDLLAQGGEPGRLGHTAEGPFVDGVIPPNLPAVPKPPMTVTTNGAVSTLSFDDGTCEGGLGVGAAGGPRTLQFLVNFDVPPQCTQAGLSVVGLSARANTVVGTAGFFVLQNASAAPIPLPGGTGIAIAGLSSQGPCPAPANFQTRAIAPGAAVVDNTIGFFAGVGGDFAFLGRDTNSPPAGRIWIQCAICGMTTYSPATLSALGLGGNWNIRVMVETNCVPVELMNIGIE